jgi:hypothetical protein
MRTPQIAKLFAVLLLTSGFTAGCSTQPEKPSVSPEAVSAINAAKAANKKAQAVGYEWRDTGKLLKKAEELANKGETEEAVKLANKAESQATLAVKQAELEKGMDRSLK